MGLRARHRNASQAMGTVTGQADKVVLVVVIRHGVLLAQRKSHMFLFGVSMPQRSRML